MKKILINIILIAAIVSYAHLIESKKIRVSYEYDTLNRLNNVNSSNEDTISYQFDDAGNILDVTTHKGENPVADAGGPYQAEPFNMIQFDASKSSDYNIY
jgi:hypothetical protein